MIEELKIIAEIMKGVTDGAVYVALYYIIYSFLKPVALTSIFCYSVYRVFALFSPRKFGEIQLLEVEDVSKKKN